MNKNNVEDIKIINSEYRLCIVKEKRALFHKWVHTKKFIRSKI